MSDEDDEAARKLVTNERRKLSATYLNGLAVAIFAVGGFAPFISAVLAGGAGAQSPLLVLAIMGVCWIMSGAIHSAARASLKGLRP